MKINFDVKIKLRKLRKEYVLNENNCNKKEENNENNRLERLG